MAGPSRRKYEVIRPLYMNLGTRGMWILGIVAGWANKAGIGGVDILFGGDQCANPCPMHSRPQDKLGSVGGRRLVL